MSAAAVRRRTPWRDNLEAITMAVVMALLLKYFIIEAYKIPTGSMQPTLIGDDKAGIKDRILVDKLSYVFRDPKRWEIAVFRYPLDRSKNFVKRIVGVGPEELRIEYGDLWHRPDRTEEWTVLRRPRNVQDSAWKELVAEEPASAWRLTRSDWTQDEGSIRARGDGQATFPSDGSSIVDRFLDGYPESVVPFMPKGHASSGINPVGDLRLDASVRPLPRTREIAIELREGSHRHRFRIPGPASDASDLPSIQSSPLGTWSDEDAGYAVAPMPFTLPAGRNTRLRVQNMDDLLELEIDGRVVASLEIPPARNQSASVLLSVEGEGADFEDVAVFRDIFYVRQGKDQVEIPAGHYYMLGDNTQDSADSREWRFLRYKIRDEAGDRIVRGNVRRGENDRTVGFGDPDGPKTFLRDEWGEAHWFRSGEAEKISSVRAPFVPVDMIQGKALAVFWPLDPIDGIYRLKWVN